ncbi:MAG: hypothetical protein WC201_02700 [Bacilli bacterium]
MKEILLNRKLNRFGTILFNIGIFCAILLFSSAFIYIFIAVFWLIAVLFIGLIIVFSFGFILADSGNRAFIGHLLTSPMENVSAIQLVAKQCAIPFCVVSCLSFIVALVFFFVLPKMRWKIPKIILCFLGIVLAVISAFLSYNIAIHG